LPVSIDFIDDFYRIWGGEFDGSNKVEERRGPYRTVQGKIADMVVDIKKDTESIIKNQEDLKNILSGKPNDPEAGTADNP
jgi:hypothetical protein